jgi:osmotically-inducible protein OsmY
MLKNLAPRIVATAFALALLLSFNASAANEVNKEEGEETTGAQKSCSKITNQELTKTIKERLADNADIKASMNHLNVSVKNRVVKLEGWLDEELIPKAVAIVNGTPCVKKKAINKLKTRGGGSCGPGQKPCGDICIDKDSTCTISSPLIDPE